MKIVDVVVNDCARDCPYFLPRAWAAGGHWNYCRHPDRDRAIQDKDCDEIEKGGFPAWCPLHDGEKHTRTGDSILETY